MTIEEARRRYRELVKSGLNMAANALRADMLWEHGEDIAKG